MKVNKKNENWSTFEKVFCAVSILGCILLWAWICYIMSVFMSLINLVR